MFHFIYYINEHFFAIKRPKLVSIIVLLRILKNKYDFNIPAQHLKIIGFKQKVIYINKTYLSILNFFSQKYPFKKVI